MLRSRLRRPLVAGPLLAALVFANIVVPAAEAHAIARNGHRSYETARAMLDRFFRSVTASAARVDSARFDLGARARALGKDPERIFRWVRDSVRIEVYDGGLRGAQGTLEGLAGNGTDRALLLAGLLRASDARDVAIIRGTLPRDRARAITARMFKTQASFVIPSDTADVEGLSASLAQAFSLTRDDILGAAVNQQLTQRSFIAQLLDRAKLDADLVGDALRTAGVPLDRPIVSPDTLVAEATRHAWIAYREATGRVLSLDPSFPDARAGQVFGTATDTVRLDREDMLQNHVAVRLLVERLSDGRLAVDTLWQRTFTSGAIATIPIRYSVIPSELDSAAVISGSIDSATLRAQATRSEGFQPIFWIDGKPEAGQAFDLKGNRRTVKGGKLDAFAAAADRISIIFGGGGTAPASELAGLRLEVAAVPSILTGGRTRVHSRILVDHLAAGTRATGASPRIDPAVASAGDASMDVLISGEVGVTTYVRNRHRLAAEGVAAIVASRATLEAALARSFNQRPPDVRPDSARLRLTRTLGWAMFSEAGAAAQPYAPEEVRAYYGEPRIALFREQVVRTPGGMRLRREYDIVHNALRVVHDAAVPNAASMARAWAIQQGAFETLAEAWMMGGPNAINTHNIVGRAVEQKVALALLRPTAPRPAELSGLAVGDVARGNIALDLERGHFVLAPEKPVDFAGAARVSWWRYNPADGTLLGMGESGAGQGAAEYLQASRVVSALLIGIPISLGVCAYMHRPGIERQSCGQTSFIADLAAALAVLILAPIAGAAIGLCLMFALGEALLAYGLVTGNGLARDVGVGMVAQVAGFAIFDELVSPLVGRFLARLFEKIGDAVEATRPWRAALAGAEAGVEAGANTAALRWPTPIRNLLHEIVFMSQRYPGRQVRRLSGEEAERMLAATVRRAAGGEHISLPTNTLLERLPQMDRVITGQFNGVNGIDLLGIAEGQLWIMESKWATSMFGRPVRLGEGVAYAGGGTQMGKLWRRIAAQSLAVSADGPQRLRQLYNLGSNVSDAAIVERFLAEVDGARLAILLPDNAMIRLVNNFPAPSADFDVSWAKDVYSFSVRP